MTVPVPDQLTYTYDEDGVTTVFPYLTQFLEPDELVVVREVDGEQTVLVYGIDYTVSGPGDPSGGAITRTSATNGGKIIITRKTKWRQDVDLEDSARNPAEAVEKQLDRFAIAGQDIAEELARAVKLPVGEDPSGLDELTADLRRVAKSADEVDVVANNIADVVDVANKMPDVNTVAGIAEEISEAAGSAAASAAESKQWSEVSEQWATEAQQHVQSVTPSVVRFSGDGVSTQFDTGIAVIDELMTNVYVTGVYQQKNTYSVVDGIITFDSPPAAGIDNIEVMIGGNVSQAFAIPSNQTVTPAKTTWVFETVSDLKAAHVPPTAWGVEILGYYDAMDGGGARYKRVFAEPSHPGKLQSADGAWWELERGQQIRVEMFGAITGLNKANATANDTAFANADAFMAAMGGGTVYMLGQYYCLTKLRWSPGVYFEGAGHGRWLPTAHTLSKTWEGTNLIAIEATKDYNVTGVTSMRYAGGWREHPDNPGEYFKLTSFMNADASGTSPATPVDMQVFAANKIKDSDGGGIKKCRIVPWIGADGISDYSNTSVIDLGDDIDVGLLLEDIEGAVVEDVQVRGFWRKAGTAMIASGSGPHSSRSQYNLIRKLSSQGFVGIAVRGGDTWAVLAATTSTVTIRWSEESYWPSSGSFRAFTQSGEIIVNYSSTSRVGDNLVFEGCDQDVSAVTTVRQRYRGLGFSGTVFEDCDGWSLNHQSSRTPAELGFSEPSKGLEISGYPLRGLTLVHVNAFGDNSDPDGSAAIFMHDARDVVFIGGKLELGFAIASPFWANSTAVAASGDTRNVRFVDLYWAVSIDRRLWTPRSQSDFQSQINPAEDNSGHFLLKALEGQDIRLMRADDQNVDVVDGGGNTLFRVTSGGNTRVIGSLMVGDDAPGLIGYPSGFGFAIREGLTARLEITSSGNITPGADNSQHLGTSSRRWSTVFAATGAINTSDEREKQQIKSIEDRVLDAWGDVQWCQFKFNDAVDQKGDSARIHYGLVAQRVIEVFRAHGLDPFAHGPICLDEWDDQYEDEFEEVVTRRAILDERGVPTGQYREERDFVPTGKKVLVRAAGSRYGLRYNEAQALEAAWQRREIAKLRMLFGS